MLLTVLLMTLMVTPAFAAEPQFMKAEQLSDEALLMMAKLNVDQRSDAVKAQTKIRASANVQGIGRKSVVEPEVYVVTLLEDRKILANGTILESYSTTAISSVSDSVTESNSSQAGEVYARVYFTFQVEGSGVEGRLDYTSHKVVEDAYNANSMEMTNNVYVNYDMDENSNSSTRSNPVSNSWYTLSAGATRFFPTMGLYMDAVTYGNFSNGTTLTVQAMVDNR